MTNTIVKPETKSPPKFIAICNFSGCNNTAEWSIGTWHCCDECAKKCVTESKPGYGCSIWGTSSRIGQEAILEFCLKWNLKFELKPII
jgi:hypothetical protein